MNLEKVLFEISDETGFETVCLEVFKQQFENNPVYRSFCDLLYRHPSEVKRVEDIPFLPISFFKSRRILTGSRPIEKTFRSSGTSGALTSQHLVSNLRLYEESFAKGFRHFFGNPQNYVILGLLPSYLERGDSSLIYMVDHLIKNSGRPESGFYLYNHEELNTTLKALEKQETKTLLLGVSFALLDFAEAFPQQLQHTLVMETGGMKGRRKELTREELHNQLCKGFGVERIYSEYGMTELLSQAYSKGAGIFQCPPWMKVLSREMEDALSIQHSQKTGGLNIIDLANLHSCSFIATEDLGKVYEDGRFEVLGRFDFSDIRGCNLMAL
jgi:phenylacetate-coenzyme A ligase PaaK-like adenylate-forming protein